MTAVRAFAALVTGTLFGFGLALGGMLDPSIIRGFLDVAGDFDPRLGFVFAGSVIVAAAGTAISRRLERPALAATFTLSQNRKIDAPLIAGSAVFGLGWGIAGLCPGPAVAGLALGVPAIAVFTAAMLVGMVAHDLARPRGEAGGEAAAAGTI